MDCMKKASLFPACLLVLFTVAGGATIYVQPGGNDGNGGGSWSAAKRTIKAAVDIAVHGDAIWVAKGIYVAQGIYIEDFMLVRSGVQLYGGFEVGDAALGDRDWKNNLTVIDADKRFRAIRIDTSADATTRIDGFVIRNGKREYYTHYGAGII
jgi:hypothetical protein